MTALRICTDCAHESSLYDAAEFCCGGRDVRPAWECDECGLRTEGTQAELLAIGWTKDGKQHECFGCSPERPRTMTRQRAAKLKAKKQQSGPGGLFGE